MCACVCLCMFQKIYIYTRESKKYKGPENLRHTRGPNVRNFVACEQQKPRPAYTTVQSDEYLRYSLSKRYVSLTEQTGLSHTWSQTQKQVFSHCSPTRSDVMKWALSRENMSSGFLTKRVSDQSPQLQRLARKFKFQLRQVYI